MSSFTLSVTYANGFGSHVHRITPDESMLDLFSDVVYFAYVNSPMLVCEFIH